VKLIVMPLALDDLRGIEEYIGRDNPKAALEFVDRLTERFDQLAQFPGIGRKRDEIRPNYRSVAEGEYIILYRKLDDASLAIIARCPW
jgi:toxin ParE1/3/4